MEGKPDIKKMLESFQVYASFRQEYEKVLKAEEEAKRIEEVAKRDFDSEFDAEKPSKEKIEHAKKQKEIYETSKKSTVKAIKDNLDSLVESADKERVLSLAAEVAQETKSKDEFAKNLGEYQYFEHYVSGKFESGEQKEAIGKFVRARSISIAEEMYKDKSDKAKLASVFAPFAGEKYLKKLAEYRLGKLKSSVDNKKIAEYLARTVKEDDDYLILGSVLTGDKPKEDKRIFKQREN